ncbi:MAG: hypothetical protein JNL54_16830 [Kineosporiaceae bacterium]|nr:hypothetical protein [Kineosporiaceae bacterium]
MSTQDITTVADEAAASTDVRRGYLTGPGFVDAPVRYSVVNGIALYDGCIDMGPVEEVERHTAQVDARLAAEAGARASITEPSATSARRPEISDAAPADPRPSSGIGLPTDSSQLWTNGVVPFVIDAGLPNQQRVTDAVTHFAQNSPIRLIARTNQADHVRFVSNGDANFSSSPIGRRGGEQVIRISNGASTGTVIHEICHSLGILHEQSRCDRDSFVTINYANVTAGFESNFDRFCTGFRDYFDYDFGSIMHYPGNAFSSNGQPTIVPRVAGVTLGQRTGLSFGDRLTIAEMYRRFTDSGHHGVWRSGNNAHALWVNATWADFVAKWQEWGAVGLRLIDVNVRNTPAGQRYSGVWSAGTGGYGLWANADWNSFVAKWQEWSAQGLRLVDLHVLRVGNAFRYTGVFLPGTGGYGLWANASWDNFVAKWQEWSAQGLRLVDVNAVRVGAQTYYTGVFLPGTGGHGLWGNASWDNFVAKWREWSAQGLRLVDVNAHVSNGQTLWTGAFLPGTDGYYLWGNAPWEGFRAKWQQLATQGLRLVDYEFTEPQHAAGPTLDAAGVPVPADQDEDSGGGIWFAEVPVPDRRAVTSEPNLDSVDGHGTGFLVTEREAGAAASATARLGDRTSDSSLNGVGADDGRGRGLLVVDGERAPTMATGSVPQHPAEGSPDDGSGQGGAVLADSPVTANGVPAGDGTGDLIVTG